MEKFYYKSPVGILEITCKDSSLVSLKYVEKTEKSDKETVFSKAVLTQLEEYFSGRRKKFDIKINPQGTNFQKKVWTELLKIPYGETRCYSEIAGNIGCPHAQRAVGSACNKNPVMIIIPCHRVISKNGRIGGFAYGVNIKAKLLDTEIDK